MRALAAATTERVIAHLDRLAEQPSCDLEGAEEVARRLVEPMPRRPVAWETLLDEVLDAYAPKSINTASPGIFSYIQGGGLYHAALADFV
jgi:aromatic-L-amino-acid decarboxylase